MILKLFQILLYIISIVQNRILNSLVIIDTYFESFNTKLFFNNKNIFLSCRKMIVLYFLLKGDTFNCLCFLPYNSFCSFMVYFLALSRMSSFYTCQIHFHSNIIKKKMQWTWLYIFRTNLLKHRSHKHAERVW